MAHYAKGRADAESPEEARKEANSRLEDLMREARQEFLRSGDPLLDWNGLEREVAERRGGVREKIEDRVR